VLLGVTALIRAAPEGILEGGCRLGELTSTLYRLMAHPQITVRRGEEGREGEGGAAPAMDSS
jgi:hypothetical protein